MSSSRTARADSAAFNVGLAVAAEHGMDVCLVASGLVLDSPGWLDRLRARTGTDGAPAAVAGGAVVESAGTIRHAGYFFSRFRRAWRARLRNVPEILLDVDKPLLCPVSSDLQFVRKEWIERVGLYDELLDRPARGARLLHPRLLRPAASACSSPPCAAAALEHADGDPDDGLPRRAAGCGSSTPA